MTKETEQRIDSKAFVALPKNPTMKDFNAKWGIRIECTEYEELENDILSIFSEYTSTIRAKAFEECKEAITATLNKEARLVDYADRNEFDEALELVLSSLQVLRDTSQ